MELAAARRPFLYFPLRNHFEQNRHVRHRLERYGAGPVHGLRDVDAGGHRRGDRRGDRSAGHVAARGVGRRGPGGGADRGTDLIQGPVPIRDGTRSGT